METAMSPDIAVYGFESSNNWKVRVALGYKEIPYTFHTIDPRDRDEVVRLSGQHLTPVLVHGDRVLVDSAAIIRYLEVNFRDRPRLLGGSRDEQWAIEDIELFARATLAAPMMAIIHHRASGGRVDDAMQLRCAEAFAEAGRALVGRLGKRDWLVGDSMTAADVTAAPVFRRVRAARLFDLPRELDVLDGWLDRVMAFDRHADGGAS
jgi:glutathione S-transferase